MRFFFGSVVVNCDVENFVVVILILLFSCAIVLLRNFCCSVVVLLRILLLLFTCFHSINCICGIQCCISTVN